MKNTKDKRTMEDDKPQITSYRVTDHVRGEYLWIPDATGWGDDVTDAEHERLCDCAGAWLDEHEGDALSITVRPSLGDQPAGIYRRRGGDWQILGYSIPVPERIEELTSKAFEQACESLGERSDRERQDEWARRVIADWRAVVWGDSPEGAEHLLRHDGLYMVTEGTGDGVYAYRVEDVEEWLEEDDGLTQDEWRRYVAEHDGDVDYDEAPYQRFVAAVDVATKIYVDDLGGQQVETDRGLVLAAWRTLGLALCNGGSEIIPSRWLPAECVEAPEVERLLAEELSVDPERVRASCDVDAYGATCWDATVEGLEQDEDDEVEVATEYGDVTVQLRTR